jgi:hypothetical protein
MTFAKKSDHHRGEIYTLDLEHCGLKIYLEHIFFYFQIMVP